VKSKFLPCNNNAFNQHLLDACVIMQSRYKQNSSPVNKSQVKTSYLTGILNSLCVRNHMNVFIVLQKKKKKKSAIVYKDNELSQLTSSGKDGSSQQRQNLY